MHTRQNMIPVSYRNTAIVIPNDLHSKSRMEYTETESRRIRGVKESAVAKHLGGDERIRLPRLSHHLHTTTYPPMNKIHTYILTIVAYLCTLNLYPKTIGVVTVNE